MDRSDEIVLTISALISLSVMIFAGFIRYNHRDRKTDEQIKNAKSWSWKLYFLALAFFIVSIIFFAIKYAQKV